MALNVILLAGRSTTNISATEWIEKKFCTDISGPQRMKPTDFGNTHISSSTANSLTLWTFSDMAWQMSEEPVKEP